MIDEETAASAAAPSETPIVAAEPKFNKQQLINSKKYQERRDLLNVVLDDGTEYSIVEVDHEIEKFMTGEVK